MVASTLQVFGSAGPSSIVRTSRMGSLMSDAMRPKPAGGQPELRRLIWNLRHKIRGTVLVGGSPLAQVVARGARLIVGASCELVDSMPALASRRGLG